MAYKRVMIKLSGEVLGGSDGVGADPDSVMKICKEVKAVAKTGVQVAIVVGGGNFWRFRDNKSLKIPRSSSDAIGMMATIMNARLLAEALRSIGVNAHALAPHSDDYFAMPYAPVRGKKLLDKKYVVVCGGGTGNPYFTTDTTAALRALELECDVLLKATKVDGVYDKDPKKHKGAKFYDKISYDEVLDRELQVMDLASIVLCKENSLKVHVFNLQVEGNMLATVKGKKIGSLIY
ncbi:UMP kinase [Patescibacteria group bacterium]|nr:UMP kinase [Patescibacteria group bacterium]